MKTNMVFKDNSGHVFFPYRKLRPDVERKGLAKTRKPGDKMSGPHLHSPGIRFFMLVLVPC